MGDWRGDGNFLGDEKFFVRVYSSSLEVWARSLAVMARVKAMTGTCLAGRPGGGRV